MLLIIVSFSFEGLIIILLKIVYGDQSFEVWEIYACLCMQAQYMQFVCSGTFLSLKDES